jgi:hypothetical protein
MPISLSFDGTEVPENLAVSNESIPLLEVISLVTKHILMANQIRK